MVVGEAGCVNGNNAFVAYAKQLNRLHQKPIKPITAEPLQEFLQRSPMRQLVHAERSHDAGHVMQLVHYAAVIASQVLHQSKHRQVLILAVCVLGLRARKQGHPCPPYHLHQMLCKPY
jgi:hypothetical protein